jgi:predicted ATP-binding protein involved in virulence
LAEQTKEAIMSKVYDQLIKTRQANVEIQQALTEIEQMEKEIKDMATCTADPKNSATFQMIIDDNKE